MSKIEFFPDGSPIDKWFYDVSTPSISELGKKYYVTDYGVLDDGKIHTEQFQSLIDTVALNGGGVIIVPKGVYRTGAIFFKQGVHLRIEKDGVILGSDDVSDYALCQTRIEGETCTYFSALINADGIDGFTITGEGTIDGNGSRAWKAFWLRAKWKPSRINKDEQRARLIYISNCKNVTIANVTIQNSQFWTSHVYKCQKVKFIGCKLFSPRTPVAAPSTDGIDVDVCDDVLVKNCYIEVNDDGVALKGGKGPYADTLPENGENNRILIEDCTFGFCHCCLTCGSESLHNRNVLLRRINVSSAVLFRMKMRPDTPQHYEYITVEDVKGEIKYFFDVNPWRQYFDLKGRPDIPMSYANNVTFRNCDCDCDTYFNVTVDDTQYKLSDFIFENLKIRANKDGFSNDAIKNAKVNNVQITIKNQ